MTQRKTSIKVSPQTFPGSTVDENLPANAGDPGSIPGPGRSPHKDPRGATKACMPQLLSLKTTATEAHVPRARAPQPEKGRDEKPAHRHWRGVLLAETRESLCKATKTQCKQKKYTYVDLERSHPKIDLPTGSTRSTWSMQSLFPRQMVTCENRDGCSMVRVPGGNRVKNRQQWGRLHSFCPASMSSSSPAWPQMRPWAETMDCGQAVVFPQPPKLLQGTLSSSSGRPCSPRPFPLRSGLLSTRQTWWIRC